MTISVSAQCHVCLKSLRSVAAKFEQCNDELERFVLWAGNIGSLHSPTSPLSLETRLRDADEVLRYVLGLLEELEDVTGELLAIVSGDREGEVAILSEEGDEEQEVQEETTELLQEIRSCITSLFRVSSLIREAAPTDLFQKALSRQRYWFNDQFDIAHVGEKFSTMQAWLKTKLGRAITQRRHYLRYIQDHREKLEAKTIEEETTRPTTSQFHPEKPAVMDFVHDSASRPSTFITKATSLAAGRITTQMLTAAAESDSGDDARSYTTISRSVDGDLDSSATARLPKLEKLRTGTKKEIECPFCYRMKKFKTERAWRRHVFSDLRTYVCTFPDCGAPFFQDLNDWFRHEMQNHRLSFTCPFCQSKPFESRDRYLAHVRKLHPDVLDDAEEQTVLGIAQKPHEQLRAEDCPCCSDWVERLQARAANTNMTTDATGAHNLYVSPTVFKRHLASHLEQLALFAVPINSNDEQVNSNAAIDENESDSSHHQQLPALSFDSGDSQRPHSSHSGSIQQPHSEVMRGGLDEATRVSQPISDKSDGSRERTKSPASKKIGEDEKAQLDASLNEVRHKLEDIPEFDSNVYNLCQKIGVLLDLQGYKDDFEASYRLETEDFRRSRGPEHLDTLICLTVLATFVSAKRKHAEAEKLLRSVLDIRSKHWPDDHIITLQCKSDIAKQIYHQGRYVEAVEWYAELVDTYERTPKLLRDTKTPHYHFERMVRDMEFLALALHHEKKHEESKDVYRRALNMSREHLGKEHGDTMKISSDFARVLEELGTYQEAEDLYRELAGIYEKTKGIYDRDTMVALFDLANVLKSQDKVVEAEEIYRRMKNTYDIAGRPDAAPFIHVIALADLLTSHERWLEVEELCEYVLKRSQELDPEPPTVQKFMQSLAISLFRQGKFEEAERRINSLVSRYEHKHGAAGSPTLRWMRKAAQVKKELGKYEEARELLQNMVKIYDDLNTLHEMEDKILCLVELADLYLQEEGEDETAQLLKRVFDAFEVTVQNEPIDQRSEMFESVSQWALQLMTVRGNLLEKWEKGDKTTFCRRILELCDKIGVDFENPTRQTALWEITSLQFATGHSEDIEQMCEDMVVKSAATSGLIIKFKWIKMLADVKLDLQKAAEAETYYRSSLELFDLGPGLDTERYVLRKGLADALVLQEKWEEAEPIYQELVDRFKTDTAAQGKDSVHCRRILSTIKGRLGKTAEAWRLEQEIREVEREAQSQASTVTHPSQREPQSAAIRASQPDQRAQDTDLGQPSASTSIRPSLEISVPSTEGDGSFRPSKYEVEPGLGSLRIEEPFQTSQLRNSHYNRAHYMNPDFQPEVANVELYKPSKDDESKAKSKADETVEHEQSDPSEASHLPRGGCGFILTELKAGVTSYPTCSCNKFSPELVVRSRCSCGHQAWHHHSDDDDEESLWTLQEKADSLADQKRYDKADVAYSEIFKKIESSTKPESSSILECLKAWAVVKHELNERDQEEKFYRQMLDLYDGPDVAQETVYGGKVDTMKALADLLYVQGRYTEAETRYETVIDMWYDGPRAAPFLQCLRNLAWTKRNLGKTKDLEQLLMRRVQIYNESDSSDDANDYVQDRIVALEELADVLDQEGRWDEAEPLYRKVLEIIEITEGAKAPHTVAIVRTLAHVNQCLGNENVAEEFYSRLESTWAEETQTWNPKTPDSLLNLAEVQQIRGRLEQANETYGRIFDSYQMMLPFGWPSIDEILNKVIRTLNEHYLSAESAEKLRGCLPLVQDEALKEQLESLCNIYGSQPSTVEHGEDQPPQATDDIWPISAEDELDYSVHFENVDTMNRGFITGAQIVRFFSDSGLTEPTLAEVWDLADTNRTGQLTKDEFTIFMHLAHQTRSGEELPKRLPPLHTLFVRRDDPTGSTSLHDEPEKAKSTSSDLDEHDPWIIRSKDDNEKGSMHPQPASSSTVAPEIGNRAQDEHSSSRPSSESHAPRPKVLNPVSPKFSRTQLPAFAPRDVSPEKDSSPLAQGPRYLYCPYCRAEFTGEQKNRDIGRHMRQEHNDRTVVGFFCEVCMKEFDTRLAVLDHYFEDHPHLHPPSSMSFSEEQTEKLQRGIQEDLYTGTWYCCQCGNGAHADHWETCIRLTCRHQRCWQCRPHDENRTLTVQPSSEIQQDLDKEKQVTTGPSITPQAQDQNQDSSGRDSDPTSGKDMEDDPTNVGYESSSSESVKSFLYYNGVKHITRGTRVTVSQETAPLVVVEVQNNGGHIQYQLRNLWTEELYEDGAWINETEVHDARESRDNLGPLRQSSGPEDTQRSSRPEHSAPTDEEVDTFWYCNSCHHGPLSDPAAVCENCGYIDPIQLPRDDSSQTDTKESDTDQEQNETNEEESRAGLERSQEEKADIGTSLTSQVDKCYNCGLVGHFARNCPNPVLTRGDETLRGDLEGSHPSACWTCGGTDHFARDCQTQAPRCYACGKLGHIARDCTAPAGGLVKPAEKTCYSCGEQGHIARDCTKFVDSTDATAPASARRKVYVHQETTIPAPFPPRPEPPITIVNSSRDTENARVARPARPARRTQAQEGMDVDETAPASIRWEPHVHQETPPAAQPTRGSGSSLENAFAAAHRLRDPKDIRGVRDTPSNQTSADSDAGPIQSDIDDISKPEGDPEGQPSAEPILTSAAPDVQGDAVMKESLKALERTQPEEEEREARQKMFDPERKADIDDIEAERADIQQSSGSHNDTESVPLTAGVSTSEDESDLLFDGPGIYHCVFSFLNCTYKSRDKSDWEVHSLAHLRGEDPPSSIECLFCDREFNREAGEPSAEIWSLFMHHIANHYYMEGHTDRKHFPPVLLTRYLWQKHLIDDHDYQILKLAIKFATLVGESDSQAESDGTASERPFHEQQEVSSVPSESDISPAQVLGFPTKIKHERSTSLQSNNIPTPMTNAARSPLPSPTAYEQHQMMHSPQSHDRRDSVDPSEHGVDQTQTGETPRFSAEEEAILEQQREAGEMYERALASGMIQDPFPWLRDLGNDRTTPPPKPAVQDSESKQDEEKEEDTQSIDPIPQGKGKAKAKSTTEQASSSTSEPEVLPYSQTSSTVDKDRYYDGGETFWFCSNCKDGPYSAWVPSCGNCGRPKY